MRITFQGGERLEVVLHGADAETQAVLEAVFGTGAIRSMRVSRPDGTVAIWRKALGELGPLELQRAREWVDSDLERAGVVTPAAGARCEALSDAALLEHDQALLDALNAATDDHVWAA